MGWKITTNVNFDDQTCAQGHTAYMVVKTASWYIKDPHSMQNLVNGSKIGSNLGKLKKKSNFDQILAKTGPIGK